MLDSTSIEREAQRTLHRILPRLAEALSNFISSDTKGWDELRAHLDTHFPRLFKLYLDLYGTRYDFFFHIEDLITIMARAWFGRPADLRALDREREANPLWFQSNQMLGGVCYVDLFAENLEGIRAKIPYFRELRLTYLHLMPLFKMPESENDGGYAISSYREVHEALGSMGQLASLARDLRSAGITLVLDFVFNHTSNEHDWAKRALLGGLDDKEIYRIYPDRSMPNAYERTLREIFPDEHPGAFTPIPSALSGAPAEMQGGWVWTTFHSYQWDLNYANPAVFNRMAEEMLFLANQGAEVLRLDAVAFIWKELGTSCENLPEAHTIIQAFNSIARISAPALLFKSEAIVHPDDVVKYISPHECQISYNPLLMALLWNSLATRKVRLLSQALETRFRLDPGCAWVNYVRSHDDIGWTFSDEDAALLGVNGYDHRRFLNEFYRGRYPGSFARGIAFQENPKTGDCRISGTCASLAGLEQALREEGPAQVELAIRRILLIHGIILTVGGIPLIYLGDEIGTLNDYTYRDHPAHARDSRWAHRPRANWEAYANRADANMTEGQVYQRLQKLIELRKSHEAFSGGKSEIIQTGNEHVLGYIRKFGNTSALVMSNFSDVPQLIARHLLAPYSFQDGQLLHGISDLSSKREITIEPLDFLVWRLDK